MKMAREKKKNFVEESELVENYKKWLQSGDTPETRVLNDGLALDIWNIATHLTGHHKFRNYSREIKDDLVSDGYMKCVKNLKNIRLDKGTVFNYLTRCCFTAFFVYLREYYKDINFMRKLIIETLEEAKGNGTIEDAEFISLLKKQLEQYNDDEGVSL